MAILMVRPGISARFLLYCAVVCVFAYLAYSPSRLQAQMATEDRLLYRAWWPRHSTASDTEYSGPAECAKCHAGKAATQKSTPMARTAVPVADSDILGTRERLSFQAGKISYQIATTTNGSVYTVTDGSQSLSAPLTWSFGDGHVGQSYLFERGGNFYESRASYFDTLKGLDFTPGRKITDPQNVEQAMARAVSGAELVRCFSCHATSSTVNDKLDRSRIIPGISCEACHGPGLKHASAQKLASAEGQVLDLDSRTDLIFNPAKLKPADAVDFCGSCHGTWWDVKLAPPVGIANVRSQPYRLEKSRCWGKNGDVRITCVACHDPHEKLVRDTASYDKNCLSCHVADIVMKATADHPGPACKVSKKDCASCHMPKYELADFHYRFTDHDIRVVRADAPYPE
ncbi:MAG: multiheme c-type cytochrome [Candidatus Sulfotelmatobacter sp.]